MYILGVGPPPNSASLGRKGGVALSWKCYGRFVEELEIILTNLYPSLSIYTLYFNSNHVCQLAPLQWPPPYTHFIEGVDMDRCVG